MINYVENRDAAKEVAEAVLIHYQRRALLVKADVSRMADRLRLIEEALITFGRIDILVNNAGVLLRKEFEEATEETWNKTLDTNLKGVYFLSRSISGPMIEQRSGKIINIASQSGVTAMKSSIEYGVSKAGVIYLTRSLARILAPYNINVNCISPGRVSTDMTGYEKNPKKRAKREREIPLGRISGPDDIAHAAVYLASEEARNVTGQILAIDGGETL